MATPTPADAPTPTPADAQAALRAIDTPSVRRKLAEIYGANAVEHEQARWRALIVRAIEASASASAPPASASVSAPPASASAPPASASIPPAPASASPASAPIPLASKPAASVPLHLFRSPGRVEIGGNHTDHNHGIVLVGTLTADIIAVVVARRRGDTTIRVANTDSGETLSIEALDGVMNPAERGTSSAIVRGVAAALRERGVVTRGFDAYTSSAVPAGQGLSSSAAFEMLIATILLHLAADHPTADHPAASDRSSVAADRAVVADHSAATDRAVVADHSAVASAASALSPIEIAKAGQEAENTYFGKPAGLEDQIGSVSGAVTKIDFEDFERIRTERVAVNFASHNLDMLVVNCQEDHVGLTAEYAAIPDEMRAVARHLGHAVLREISEQSFMRAVPDLRAACGDRAVLRALHYYQENRRVLAQIEALRADRLSDFLAMVRKSGQSSWMLLQNCIAAGKTRQQGMAYALALTEGYIHSNDLERRAACRVHGGGFAGAILLFLPSAHGEAYRAYIERLIGPHVVIPLRISPLGACHLETFTLG